MGVLNDWKQQRNTWKAIHNVLSNMQPDTWYSYEKLTKLFPYGYVATQKMVVLLKEQKLLNERGTRREGKEFKLNELGLQTKKMVGLVGLKISPSKVNKACKEYENANNSSVR